MVSLHAQSNTASFSFKSFITFTTPLGATYVINNFPLPTIPKFSAHAMAYILCSKGLNLTYLFSKIVVLYIIIYKFSFKLQKVLQILF
jgi:hypothetical protein